MRLARRLLAEIGDDGVFDAAAGVAFWLLLSLPAAALTALSTVSLLGDDLTNTLRESALEFVDRVFAEESAALRDSIDGLFDQSRPAVLSLSLAIALFTVSRGFAGLIRALDTVYDVEENRNFIHTRAVGIGLAVGTFVVVAGSTALWALAADRGVPVVARLAVGVVVLIVWASTMYHVAPNLHTPWRYDLPGALLTAVGWMALSVGYGWYVSIVGDGNQFVGATGAILLGLTWLWAACVVFLVGGELNQLIAHRAGVISEPDNIYRRAEALAKERILETLADTGLVGNDDEPSRADEERRDPHEAPATRPVVDGGDER